MGKSKNFRIFYALSFAWQLGFLIAIPMAGFILLGLFIDKIFETRPTALIFGICIGFAINIYEIYHILKPLIKDKDKDNKNEGD